MNPPKTLLDTVNALIRNNPILVTLIVLGSIVIALSTFTDAAKKLLKMVIPKTRPDVNGQWKAEVSYDWNNAQYTEIFTFTGDGTEVHGTASFLGTKRGILEGELRENKIQFVTKTQEVQGSQEPKLSIHRYRGKFMKDEIKFVMQTGGGTSEHGPIAFTAKKIPETEIPLTR